MGRFCRLEPLDPEQHAEGLYATLSRDEEGRSWTYLPDGPFDSFEDYRRWLDTCVQRSDALFFAIILRSTPKPLGVASYCRIFPENGSIEVGNIHYSDLLKRSTAATEAMFLMMQEVFKLGYRRYEWKCDALNEASRSAALRLGFRFEGIFRQAEVYKNRSRDSAWFSVTDTEWPALKNCFDQWLSPENFDEVGKQHVRFSDLTRETLSQ